MHYLAYFQQFYLLPNFTMILMIEKLRAIKIFGNILSLLDHITVYILGLINDYL